MKKVILLLFLCCFMASPCGKSGPTAEQMKVVNQGLTLLNKQKYKAAAARFRALAEEGLPSAQEIMGILSEKGLGVPQSYREAIEWYMIAAEHDNHLSQFCLGALYADGHGLPRSESAAKSWFLLAKENGNKYAQFRLDLLNREFGADQDYHQFIRQAAREGNAEAQYLLANRFRDGEGVEPDLQTALHWYSEAIKQKHFLAQYEIMRLDPTLEYLKNIIDPDAEGKAQAKKEGKAAVDGSGEPDKKDSEKLAKAGKAGRKPQEGKAAGQRKGQQAKGKPKKKKPVARGKAGQGKKQGKGLTDKEAALKKEWEARREHAERQRRAAQGAGPGGKKKPNPKQGAKKGPRKRPGQGKAADPCCGESGSKTATQDGK
ncbi:MAG: tetratricopeptide repeat protein [Planctomycetota bacterium]